MCKGTFMGGFSRTPCNAPTPLSCTSQGQKFNSAQWEMRLFSRVSHHVRTIIIMVWILPKLLGLRPLALGGFRRPERAQPGQGQRRGAHGDGAAGRGRRLPCWGEGTPPRAAASRLGRSPVRGVRGCQHCWGCYGRVRKGYKGCLGVHLGYTDSYQGHQFDGVLNNFHLTRDVTGMMTPQKVCL